MSCLKTEIKETESKYILNVATRERKEQSEYTAHAKCLCTCKMVDHVYAHRMSSMMDAIFIRLLIELHCTCFTHLTPTYLRRFYTERTLILYTGLYTQGSRLISP
jgi:hypothetical protein